MRGGMEGVKPISFKFKPLCKGEKMQFALGLLTMLSFALLVALWLLWVKYNKVNDHFALVTRNEFGGVIGRLDDLFSLVNDILNRPTTQNVIHLGLKEIAVDTKLEPLQLSINPEDFQVKREKIVARLMHEFATEKHSSIPTRAFCMLNHAGVREMLTNQSANELDAALTRLLVNEDDDATKRFLETVADSVSQVQRA